MEDKKPDEAFTVNKGQARKWNWKLTFLATGLAVVLFTIMVIVFTGAVSAPPTPDPVIVSSFMDGTPSTLTDYAVRVVADVRNDGAEGQIVFEATVFEGNKVWTKTATAVMTAKETRRFEIVFDEPGIASKQEFGAKAYPLE